MEGSVSHFVPYPYLVPRPNNIEEDASENENDDRSNFIISLLSDYLATKQYLKKVNLVLNLLLSSLMINLGCKTIMKEEQESTKFYLQDDDKKEETLVLEGGVKGFNRLLSKVVLEYNYMFNRCCDVLRFTMYIYKVPGLVKDNLLNYLKLIENKIICLENPKKRLIKLARIKQYDKYCLTQWAIFDDEEKINSFLYKADLMKANELQREEYNKKKEEIQQKYNVKEEDLKRRRIDYESRLLAEEKFSTENVKAIFSIKDNNIFNLNKINDCPINETQLQKFEIQFHFEKFEQDHLQYEIDRLQVVTDVFQLSVQKVILKEIMYKLDDENGPIKNKYYKSIKELYNLSNLNKYNDKVLNLKNQMIII